MNAIAQRPSLLARPVGHTRVIDRLDGMARSLAQGTAVPLPHALVFTGPSGVGKYHTARWWTARLKCRAGTNCDGRCPDCTRVVVGSHPDVRVLELAEDAKEIGIADVRNLIRLMSLKSVSPGPRVGIVRDAEKLSFAAQGAMLKLLEEPPGLAVLILVTQNPGALLPTVRSRCQTYRFGALDEDTVRAVLEQAGTDPTLAREAAMHSRGSIGRATTMTDESIAERVALIEALERFRNGAGISEMLTTLTNTADGIESALATLWEWQLTKVRAALGYRAPPESGRLASSVEAVIETDYRRALRDAARIHEALDAIGRRGNVRLVVRDMLFDLGDP